MENVMRNAWVIARKGQNTFGGSVKQYFSEALKIAWSLLKRGGNGMDYAKQVKGTLSQIADVELEGSEKQIAWAKEIRKEAAADLLSNDIMYEQYEIVSRLPQGKSEIGSRSVKNLVAALRSEETIKAHFEEMKAQGVHESRYEDTVKSMNDALDRFERLREIMSNTSAKFWIDNRPNQDKNYRFRAFKAYVNTGVKKF